MTVTIGATVTPSESKGMARHNIQTFITEVKEKGEIQEYLGLLLRQETQLYSPCNDYLTVMKEMSASSNVDPVTEGWRRKLCEWAYEVVDHFSFDRDVVFIALDYLDRFVARWLSDTEANVTKNEYQLLAVTAIYMAIKVHGETDSIEGPRRKLRIDAFYELSRKQFDVQVIEHTERIMLQTLNWNINPPTALKFISTLLSLCPKWQGTSVTPKHSSVLGGIYDVARYLSELSVCQTAFSFSCKTSMTAYASLLCAIEARNATMPLPYEVRVRFLSNIAETTGLLAEDAEVLRICSMLKLLCPRMFEDIGSLMDDDTTEDDDGVEEDDHMDDGKASPICVINEEHNAACRAAEASRRKRSRSDENWRPIGSTGPNRTS